MSDEPRNEGKQNPSEPVKETKVEIELTKKNADFMHHLKKELAVSKLDDEHQQLALEETKQQLLDGQKNGVTAKQLFQTPTKRAQEIVLGPKKAQATATSNSVWLRGLDNGLMFMALFSAMYAIMMFFEQKQLQQTPGQAGILAIILTSAVGGLGIGYIYRYLGNSKKRPSMWKQLFVLVAAVLVWMFFYMSFAMLPASINPMLNAYGYIIMAVLAFGARFLIRRKYHIVGGLF